MTKENILFIISVLLSIIIITFSTYILLSKINKVEDTSNQQKENIEIAKEDENTPEVEENIEVKIPDTKTEFLYSAWIPSSDFDKGYESLEKNKDLIKEVNPVLYGVNNDGTLLNRQPAQEKLNDFLLFCSMQNIKVVPTIGSYDYKTMDTILQSDIYIQKHIEEIIKDIQKYNYDGIDIDYEKIRTSNKDGYLLFLTKLKSQLDEIDKTLSVTVFAKTRDSNTDTLYAQDWVEIGKIADIVKIMAYDYTLQTSTIPGPIGPTDWIKEVLEYSKGKIEPEKISLGIHLYGYLWKGEKASALTYSSVSSILSNTKIQKEYKEDIHEGYAQYTCSDGTKCILFYQTPEGIQERVKLAKENNLAGVTYWRLGNDPL